MRYIFYLSVFSLVFLFSCEKVEDKGTLNKKSSIKTKKEDVTKLKKNDVVVDFEKNLRKRFKKERLANIKFIDSDKDGIHDLIDKCPNKKEVKNGINDNDGCPD